jgi:DtxR family Mn-dependent transcriptional regulator
MTQTISSNMEDYLEVIVFLKEKNEVVRVKDIGEKLGVKNPSVSEALGVLSKKGLVKHKRYGNVELTKRGDKLAKTIARRHNTLVKFLKEVLKIDQKTAREDACRMEHSISKDTARKLTNFINFIEDSPYSGRPQWLKSFDNFEKTGKRLNCRMRQDKV